MAKKRTSPRDAPLHRSCGAMAAHMMLLERFPAFRANQMRLEGATCRRRDARLDLKKSKLVTIKTVVNVVYKTAEQNISDAQIKSQITALNKDFRATNPDKNQTPDAVEGTGHRRAHPVQARQGDADQDDEERLHVRRRRQEALDGRHRAVQPKTHLNLWVCALTGGLLGYAQFPGGPTATDGVVINYQAFGTTGTAQAPFNKGRTATHEVGHYFNLRHIWGDTPDCSGSDMVADTPELRGPELRHAHVARSSPATTARTATCS